MNDSEKQPVGLVFSAIGKNSHCIEIAENHARKCAGNGRLNLTSRVKSGFQLIETFRCGFCKRDYNIKSEPESDSNTIKKKEGQVSKICKIIGHSAYHAALAKTMLGEFLDQAGYVRPFALSFWRHNFCKHKQYWMMMELSIDSGVLLVVSILLRRHARACR